MKKILLFLALLQYILSADGYTEAKPDVKVLAKSTKSWDGNTLSPYPIGQPEVTILNIKIPPKTKLHIHKHPVINAGVLLKGELTVASEDGETLHLKTGDAIVEMVEKWHYGINEGSEIAEIIVVYAGIEGKPVTVFKSELEH